MFNWFKRLFTKKINVTRWLLIYNLERKGSTERIELGTFNGSQEDAMDECHQRQLEWFFRSGIMEAAVGTYGIEPLEEEDGKETVS